MFFVMCYLFFDICYLLFVMCYLIFSICYLLYVICDIPCCMLCVISLPVHHRGEETDLGTSHSLTRLPFVPRNTVGRGRTGSRVVAFRSLLFVIYCSFYIFIICWLIFVIFHGLVVICYVVFVGCYLLFGICYLYVFI